MHNKWQEIHFQHFKTVIFFFLMLNAHKLCFWVRKCRIDILCYRENAINKTVEIYQCYIMYKRNYKPNSLQIGVIRYQMARNQSWEMSLFISLVRAGGMHGWIDLVFICRWIISHKIYHWLIQWLIEVQTNQYIIDTLDSYKV